MILDVIGYIGIGFEVILRVCVCILIGDSPLRGVWLVVGLLS